MIFITQYLGIKITQQNNFFCNLPFTEIQTGNGIKASPCCVFKPTAPITVKGYATDPQMRIVRETLLKGEVPVQCTTCVESEKSNGHSFRLMAETFHPGKSDEIKKKNDPEYLNIKSVTVGTSQVCNLKCLPCLHSSYVRRIELHKLGFIKLKPVLQTHEHISDILMYDFDHVSLLGGEPFYDKVTFEFLELLVKANRSKNIRVDINTNLTYINREKLLFLTDNFKSVFIKGSIDGIGEVNDYLRYPSVWSEIEANIQLIQSFPKIDLVMTTALSNLAMIKFYQVIEWCAERNLNLFITSVNEPEVMQPSLLPVKVKQKLLPIYTELKSRLAGKVWNRTEHCIDSAIHICSEPTTGDFSKFKSWIEQHDKLRNNSVTKVFAELIDYVET